MKGLVRGVLPVVIVATMTVACQTVQTTGGGAVGVQRSQMMMVSAKEVEQASRQQYQQMLAEARQKNALNRDPAMVQRVRTIVARLTARRCAGVAVGGECVLLQRAQRLVHGGRQDGHLHRFDRALEAD